MLKMAAWPEETSAPSFGLWAAASRGNGARPGNGARRAGPACQASGVGAILGDDFPRLGILIAAFHFWQDHACLGVNDPAIGPRVKFTGSWVHNPFLFLLMRRGGLRRGRHRAGGQGRICRRSGGRRGRRVMLGGKGREDLGKHHGFPLDDQKKKDRCESQP
jgi:hypothetical protein